MTTRKFLITGAGGLLGRYVVDACRDRAELTGLDLMPRASDDGLAGYWQGSIEDADLVRRAVDGVDTVIHVAARPNIWSGRSDEIIRTNVTGTWNVLEAAEAAGVSRVIVTSSDSVAGYTVLQGAMIPPLTLPIDNTHPIRPTDAYALSKKLCEEIARSFLDRGRLEVVVLRPVYVLYPEFECEVIARSRNPGGYKGPDAGGRQPAGGGVMWHYVDPRDLARAFRLAAEHPSPGFGPYFICGPNTLAPDPTLDRLAARMGGKRIPVAHPEVYLNNPYAPLYDLAGARDAFGFVAEHDLRPRLLAAAKA